jgi:LCP family protein required for cell wall assembly
VEGKMQRIKFSELSENKTKTTMKLRKGRVTLIVSFIIFLVLDVFLVAEYQTRGVNAVGYQIMEKVSEVFESGANLVSSIWEPEVKHTDNYTSMLVVGIDSRNVEFNGTEFVNTSPENQAGTRNADTIIQVVYDHSNGEVTMISIPRDMGIDIEKECLEFHGSIHWVYDKGQSANCPGGGVQTIIDVAEGITGFDVHYYAFVTFDVFEDIINAVGDVNEDGERGIWIYLDEPVYELYPINDAGWESVYFPKGHQFLTAERALKFARSRQTSSDFGRALRQQIVIEAIKDRIMSSNTLLNPKKLYSLIQAFKKSTLFSEPNIEEIRAGLNIARDLDTSEILNIVLDPEFGGHEVYINKQPHDRLTAQYYMVPTHWRECPGDEFCKIQAFIRKIMNYPEVYEENASVIMYARDYGSDWKPDFGNSKYQAFKNNGLPIVITESKYIAKIPGDNDIVIFDFTNGEKSNTLDALSRELGVDITSGSEAPNIRINDEDIAIVVNGE